MSVDCRIFLPPAVRVNDVADVIGALVGLKPEKRKFSQSDGYSVHVGGVNVVATSGSVPTMLNISLTAPDGEKLVDGEQSHFVYYHFESLDPAGKPCRLLMPKSTAFRIAVGRGLIRFFGGSLDYSDCDEAEVNESRKAKSVSFAHAEDGDDWYALQDAKLAVPAITREEIAACAKHAAY